MQNKNMKEDFSNVHHRFQIRLISIKGKNKKYKNCSIINELLQ